ncbi:glypican-3 isoform X2 [Denticeps clupeoides]|uniref:glypican-3 isoform X2 n=1 Tax=Denticeps clupeoides TaxID=299321 RepID=UPI0010A36951|nr:glypican-3-like isoform X2 [Denticeps clupeoides]
MSITTTTTSTMALLLVAFSLLPPPCPGAQVPGCQEVRSSFQFLYPGMKWAPETPLSGMDLQVCQSKGLSCCTRKMEERYLLTAKQNMESNLQASTSQLKLLLIQNAALFQAFEIVLRLGHNATLLILRNEFPALGGGASGVVSQLFREVSLYILGSDARIDHMVDQFFTRLFPLTFRRLLGGGATLPLGSDDCLRGMWQKGPNHGAFGPYPKLLMTRLSRSLLTTRIFLQALNLGIEVVNTTQHLRVGRDCGRALLRLWYCPLCQGLLDGVRLCPMLCMGVMQGCLGGAREVQPQWRSFVDGLGRLVEVMQGEQDVEVVAMGIPTLVRSALRHAMSGRSRIHSLVSGVCANTPQRTARSAAVALDLPRPITRTSQPVTSEHPEETLSGRRREFMTRLRSFGSFYSSLEHVLCNQKEQPLNTSLCWNGQEMTDKFPGPGPRKNHKSPEPVISQIIDKLKHINQLLQMVTAPEKRWRARPGGSGVKRDPDGRGPEAAADMAGSGDCDDEDECISGLGPPPRHKQLRIFAELADNLAIDDLTFHELLLTPQLSQDSHGGASVVAAAGVSGPCGALFIVTFIIVMRAGIH